MKAMTEELKFADLFPEEAGKLAQRLHIKKDEIPFIRKSYVSEKSEVKPEERAVISYISTIAKDRDNEQLLPTGVQLENYRKNPVVLYGHRYDSVPIGKNIWIKQDDRGLIAKTVFAKTEFADQLYRAYTEDIEGTGPLLKGWSVGFIPRKWEEPKEKDAEDAPRRIYTEWELLEYSAVAIPSCPEALTLAYQKDLIPASIRADLDAVKEDMEIKIEPDDPEIEIEPDDPDIEFEDDDEDKDEDEIEDFQEEIEIENEVKTMTPDELKAYYRNLDEAVTKPETTENYHRIPVSTGHDDHKIRTIVVSAKQGIKGLYCVDCKKIITYLFDTNKWSMDEAQEWVKEHRRGISEMVTKIFDVEAVDAPPATFNYALFEKFLECKVKEIFQNTFVIPSPLIGTYLAGFKKLFGKYKLLDTRSFRYDGSEVPPEREVIQLNSIESDDFLIDGVEFYDADGKPLALKFALSWSGLGASIVTSTKYRDWNKGLLEKVHAWVEENNYLKGEKFALNGEFLKEPTEDWEGLVLNGKFKDAVRKSVNLLEKTGEKTAHRGLLFIGPPGTGKTKTGRVIMGNSDATFIWVSSKDFRRIGPLNGLSLAFSLARDLAPTVLFIEDIDNWLREYSGDSIVVDLVKTEMDGLRQNKGIITILTSNYPEKLPDALLDRPGRFHHIINFELPKSEQRKEMLKLWAENIDEDLLVDIVKQTEGFSGAHIKELVDFAKIIAEEENVSIGKALLLSLEKLMEQRELINDIRQNRKSLIAALNKAFGKEVEIKAEEKAEFTCECIECGHKVETDEHCKDIKCPECGGDMRREERPGPGRSYDEAEHEPDDKADLSEMRQLISDVKSELAELKEGRVLSTRNRTLVKDTIDTLNELKDRLEELYNATEPSGPESSNEDDKEIDIVVEKSNDEKPEIADADIAAIVKQVTDEKLKPEALKEAVEFAIKKLRGIVE